MKPEDVPDELIEVAYQAYLRAPQIPINDVSVWGYALAAVLPAHERQVRERVAAEIRETARSLREDGQISQDGWRGYVAAAYIAQEGARIARGES